MAITTPVHEKVWFDKASHEKAERVHFENIAKLSTINTTCSTSNEELLKRIEAIELKNERLEASLQKVNQNLAELLITVQKLQANQSCPPVTPHIAVCPAKPSAAEAPKDNDNDDDDDDDDVDLFGSDSEDEDAEAARIRKERLEAYAAKKSKKPALIAKSNIILDIKPWDDETDMEAMEAEVRKIKCDGLLWGAAKKVPLAYTIVKLQISCVIEDDKVSVDWLTEQIEGITELVQSVDIAAFNKI
ncbi:probable elongation factor 1-delta isoform X2 [Chelonus insularis]|uniref:probable elongation factor 1-delta isoform X2 n=1 Tax=Chelonus insularis TaxID=460826 RepID=UPI00158B0DD7|nr:probable elongation factor 1-delta isoform X2 [Chelonus insularis]